MSVGYDPIARQLAQNAMTAASTGAASASAAAGHASEAASAATTATGAAQSAQSSAGSAGVAATSASAAAAAAHQAAVDVTTLTLVSTPGTELAPGKAYGLHTSSGDLAPVLPALATVAPGARIEIDDMDFDAASHNQTIHAAAGDTIVYQDQAAASSFTMSTSGICLRFKSNTTYWRVTTYAQ